MKNLVTMAEKYDIYVGEKKVHSSITEDEMLDITQDFADEFYQVGTPHPDDVRVEYLGYDIEDEQDSDRLTLATEYLYSLP